MPSLISVTSALVLCAAAALRAADPSTPGPGDFVDPPKALWKSPAPLTLAMQFLEAGDAPAVRDYAKALGRAEKTDMANKVLSLLEFFDGNYAGSLQALENIPSPDAWAQQQKRYVQGLVSVQAGWVEARSEHFRFRTPPEDAFLAQYALPALENAYARMAESFQVTPDTSVVVEVYPSEEQFSYASTLSADALERSGAIGICKFGRLMILSPKAAPMGYRWLDTLAHEYNHLLVNRLSGSLCPLWLHEGVARAYETAWRRPGPFQHTPHAETRLAEAALVNPSTGALLIPFQRMEPSMVNLNNQDEVALAFAEVSDAVAYLADQFGADKLTELLASFRRLPRAQAFAEALEMTEPEFEEAWKASLQGRPWKLSRGAMGRDIRLKPVDEAEFVGADARGNIRLGDRLRQQGQHPAALLQYKKALEKEPDNGVALVKSARAHLALDAPEKAEKVLRHAVEKNESYPTPHVMLGELLYDDGRYEEAQAVLQEALEINPFHPKIHELLGLIAVDVGNFPSARQSIELSLRLDPGNRDLREALRRMPKGPR